MPVVGTAGHVDHGKSTLVTALTGRDPDRWEEEKRRGLTIDLGFAWATFDGVEVSFVDVPGHERYVKNMLAGVEAIDLALMVVAADEGWMPQSEEHAAVLDLLGVDRGVVALTKVDRVDEDLTSLALLEVEEKLAGTSLEGAPVIPVSAVTRHNMDALVAELTELVHRVDPPDRGRARMWIDRVFTIAGAGTVVTGTLLDGWLEVGRQVEIWPGPTTGRIRSLQTHEREVDRVGPGRRVAVNLGGTPKEQITRGSMLGLPDHWRPTSRFLARIRTARYVEELTNRGAYQLHVGSGAFPVAVRIIAEDLVVIDLPQPLPLAVGDRFILRDTGRRLVVAGGRVVDPAPPKPRRLRRLDLDLLRQLPEASPELQARTLLAVRGSSSLDELSAHTGGGVPSDAVRIGRVLFSAERADELTRRLEEMVGAYHRSHPLRPGLGLAEAAERLGVTSELVATLVERSPDLALTGAAVHHRDHTVDRTRDQEAAWSRARQRLAEAEDGRVPRVDELGLPTELLAALIREGSLVRISPDLVYLPEQVDRLVGVVRSFAEPFTVSEFKDRAGISRKYAVPFLEWADDQGLTVRMGDRRRVR
ncbi:MAG: selenocysteine-specific translation factor [Acidimicrobiia bacterium]|nr:MAG: selenocysteine-specific translation factor [Acidimicrobiia bacterium]